MITFLRCLGAVLFLYGLGFAAYYTVRGIIAYLKKFTGSGKDENKS